ncbi:hypothetical protein ACM61V_04350 [Sphingomonas sp. TX0543]|uniref:hypothetical protein n=1 Tax=unclassified Sphingomonas TaxID=196159 RepID=UPI0014859E88|nr:hypothetical protein [Sphingomonas sp. 3P27F8]
MFEIKTLDRTDLRRLAAMVGDRLPRSATAPSRRRTSIDSRRWSMTTDEIVVAPQRLAA